MLYSHQFHPQLVLRTPTRPFDEHIGPAMIDELLHDGPFLEALYLASPVLWGECQKWLRGELSEPRRLDKLRRSLTRYYVRATTRCIPFGLFAGCALVTWGSATHLRLAPTRPSRHTRLDMHYLCALAQSLASRPALRQRLRYWPNTTLYATGEEFRYIEYQYVHGERVNQLSAVAGSPPVIQVLQAAQGGLRYAELLVVLEAYGASRPEAAEFLEELIEAQLLVHELEPTVTGPEFLTHMQAVLTRLLIEAPHPEIAALVDQLREVSQGLRDLDQASVNAPPYAYLLTLLAPLGVRLEENKLFQTDVIQKLDPADSTVDLTIQADLLGALDLLLRLTPVPLTSRLADFTSRFVTRYGEREVPLLEALDNESGLSYTNFGQSTFSPLVHDLLLPDTGKLTVAAPLGAAHQLLARKLRQAAQLGQYSIEIMADDLRDCPASALPLPPSLAVMFRLVGNGHVLLESAGGSSAVNLLGRFAHASPAIEQLVCEVTTHEQTLNPAVDFAEICHLPTSRVGNVLLRPSFRSLEITYMAQGALPTNKQVRVQDLRLAVRDGHLVLYSGATGQRIMPRLSTAHNFTHEALPVYQFLCDLQTQDLQSHLGVSWPVAAEETIFLPRLTYQRVILVPATWQLDAAELRPLLAVPKAEQLVALAQFRRQWHLPRWFVLAEGDNELFVDADNAWLVHTWLEAVRPLPRVQLKEFLFDPTTSPMRDAVGRPHPQQLIALLLGQQASYPALPLRPVPSCAVQRDFALGSKWLYYKLYCGQKRADYVLLALVRPLTEDLAAAGLIEDWFFIRYADPDNHLRLRLRLRSPNDCGEVLQYVAGHLQPFQTNGTVWKTQLDTYSRELERYGSRTIELSEQLFGWQSRALLTQLAESLPLVGAAESWLWGLSAIDELLDAFTYSLPQKTALLGELRAAFAREFGLDKSLQLQLDAKFRRARRAIVQQLATRSPVPEALAALASSINAQVAVEPPEVALAELLTAYIHMLLNRLLPDEARLHELVLYDFLHRHYQATSAQQNRRP